MVEYIKSFVAGSSAPVILPFLYRASLDRWSDRKYSYEEYSFIAPLFFGTTSSIAAAIHYNFNISLFYSLLIVTIIRPEAPRHFLE